MPNAAAVTETREMPMLDLRAAAIASTFDAEKRTVEITWTTGAKGLRSTWSEDYYEELAVDESSIRLGRLNAGAPVLDSHRSYGGVGNVIAVVERAWIAGGEGRALIRFSDRDAVKPIMQDVRDGILRNISVGYQVHKFERIRAEEKGEPDTYRAIDWEPMELSIVPIPFDAGAQVRSAQPVNKVEITTRGTAATVQEEKKMPDANTPVVEKPAAVQPNVEEIRAEATKAERDRVSQIRSAVTKAALPAEIADKLISDGVAIDAAREQIIDAIADKQSKEQPQQRSHAPVIEIKGEEVVQRREAIENAIRHRADPNSVKLTDQGRQFRGMTLIDLARDSIEASGGKARGLTPREIALCALNIDSGLMARAGLHSTSDFPIILGNTVNRTLRAAYEVAAPTFRPWTRRANAKDFRDIIRSQIGDVTKLDLVLEGGEYKYGTVGEGKEQYRVAKYGKIIALTWETLINDDLDAFSRIPASFGQAAAQLESDIVYGILTTNAALSDTGALFNATAVTTAGGHANLAGSGGAIDLTTLGAGRAAMFKQKSLGDGKTKGNGYNLNLSPKFLVVGPDYAQLAYQYTSSAYVPTTAAGVQIPQNVALQVIVDGRLTGNQWYLMADPAQVDTIEYAYLDGEEGIFTETRQGFEVDGVEIKVRHVFGAKAIDFRGMYKNAGA